MSNIVLPESVAYLYPTCFRYRVPNPVGSCAPDPWCGRRAPVFAVTSCPEEAFQPAKDARASQRARRRDRTVPRSGAAGAGFEEEVGCGQHDHIDEAADQGQASGLEDGDEDQPEAHDGSQRAERGAAGKVSEFRGGKVAAEFHVGGEGYEPRQQHAYQGGADDGNESVLGRPPLERQREQNSERGNDEGAAG